jgi:organic radical activating enzyme
MKLRYSEAFYSVQGEGKHVGVPSVFLRVFGCNFNCAGFGQPKGDLIASSEMPYMTDLRADPNHKEAYTDISELPVTLLGCDSSASWSNRYKHLQLTQTVEEVFDTIMALTPDNSFVGLWGQRIHLVITGGEPLLGWQRIWPELLSLLYAEGLRDVTFETNGTQIVTRNLMEFFNDYAEGQNINVTWSVSPKLSISGELIEETLVPESLLSMNKVKNSFLYTKFVVREAECFDEAEEFLKQYDDVSGVKIDSVYCMPEGAVLEQYTLTAPVVVDECMKRGWKFSPRLHIDLFGNKWGT